MDPLTFLENFYVLKIIYRNEVLWSGINKKRY